MQYTQNLYTVIEWLIEDKVIPDDETTHINQQFGLLSPHVRMIAQESELTCYIFDEFIQPLPRCALRRMPKSFASLLRQQQRP